MKTNNIYLVIIIFLLTTNIATIVMVDKRSNKLDETNKPIIDQPRISRMNFMWDELGLTPDQRSDVTGYNNEYNNRARSITKELNQLREEIVREMSSDSPDSNRLDTIIEELGARHIELKQETVDFYNQINAVCDSQQRERLEFLFRDMLNPDGIIYGRGRGGEGRGRMYMERGPRNGEGRGRGREYNR